MYLSHAHTAPYCMQVFVKFLLCSGGCLTFNVIFEFCVQYFIEHTLVKPLTLIFGVMLHGYLHSFFTCVCIAICISWSIALVALYIILWIPAGDVFIMLKGG